MKDFKGLTKRNLLVFFKDKQTIVFSLLTSIIVLVLYLLFLKTSFVDAMNSSLNEYPGLNMLISGDEIDMFANLFLLTGILGSAMITVPFNCLTILVKDKENKVDYDMLATPVKRGKIILSYFVSSALSSVILNGIILTIGLVVIRTQGNIYMNAIQILGAFGVVALGSVSATALFMIIVLLFKSTSASGAFFGMLSAASGFVIGAYIPLSQFSKEVQTVCNIFPASQVTIVLRNALMNGVLNHMDESLNGIDGGMFVSSLKELFSFKARFLDTTYGVKTMLVYITVAIVVCAALQVVLYAKTYKKR